MLDGNELTFESEEAKAQAIETFDESKGGLDELQRVMDAKVVAKEGGEADVTPPQTPEPAAIQQPVPEPVAAKPADAPKADVTPPQPALPAELEAKIKEKGYKSAAEFFKAFDEQKALIDRQTTYIRENVETSGERIGALQRQIDEMKARQQSPSAPASTPAPPQERIATTQADVAKIDSMLEQNRQAFDKLYEELEADPSLRLDSTFVKRERALNEQNHDLNKMLRAETVRLDGLYRDASHKVDAAAYQAQQIAQGQQERSREDESRRVYLREMQEIDDFAERHPEFHFSEGRTSVDVEKEWIAWANMVATAAAGAKVDRSSSPQAREYTDEVLSLLAQGDPDVITKCKVMGVPTEPSADASRYIEICQLLDYRDGVEIDPVTGKRAERTRMVPDGKGGFARERVRLPGLEEAYQLRLTKDGTYAKKIQEAYRAGAAAVSAAISRREGAPVELGNAEGASRADAGVDPTVEEALKAIEQIDEREALSQRLAGNSKLWDQLEAANEILRRSYSSAS